MPAPVYLNVWHPAHPAGSFLLLIEVYPPDTKIEVASTPAKPPYLTEVNDIRPGLKVWAITDVPATVDLLELHIYATPRDSTKWSEAYRQVNVGTHRRFFGMVHISYPIGTQQNPCLVATNFPTYGTVNPTTSPVTAYLQLNGGGPQLQVTQATEPGPLGYNWGTGFSGLTSGNVYELTVTEPGGGVDQSWVVIQ